MKPYGMCDGCYECESYCECGRIGAHTCNGLSDEGYRFVEAMPVSEIAGLFADDPDYPRSVAQ